jgi:hypothetical protein
MFAVAGGDVLTESGFGALALLVGGVQTHAQLVGGGFHADVVKAGDGEQFDVPLGQRLAGVCERGQELVEEAAEFFVRRATGHGLAVGHGRSTFPRVLDSFRLPGLLALGVGDAALDQLHAEVRRSDVDGLHPFQEAVEQVVVDIGGVVAVGHGDALAGAA